MGGIGAEDVVSEAGTGVAHVSPVEGDDAAGGGGRIQDRRGGRSRQWYALSGDAGSEVLGDVSGRERAVGDANRGDIQTAEDGGVPVPVVLGAQADRETGNRH